jgi:hypothetical protein
MARPSAASSRMEPRLTPVKTTPMRSPQARRPRRCRAAPGSAARTSGSVSASGARRSCSRLDRPLAAAGQRGARRQALGLVARRDEDGGAHALERGLQRGIALGLARPSRAAAAGPRRALLEQLGHAGAARLDVGREQLQRAQRGLQRAAHAVVVDHVLGVGRHGARRARGRIDRLVALHDEDLVARDLDRVVEQRLHERPEARIGPGRGGLVQRGDALVAVTRRDGQRLLGRQREGCNRTAEQHTAENESSNHSSEVQKKTRTGRRPSALQADAADPASPVRWRRPLEGERRQALRGWVTSSRARSSCPCSRRCSRSTGRQPPGPWSSTPR